MKRRAAIALVLAMLSGPAVAQEMRPLNEAVHTAARDYGFIRCSGLFQAQLDWIGTDRAGQGMTNSFTRALEAFWVLALAIRVDDGMGSFEQVAGPTNRDIANVRDLYIARFERNYAIVGQAFGQDALVSADMEYCAVLGRQTIRAVGEVE